MHVVDVLPKEGRLQNTPSAKTHASTKNQANADEVFSLAVFMFMCAWSPCSGYIPRTMSQTYIFH